MKLSRIVNALLVAALIAGCSSEGGVVGTGISSSISGNIASVDSTTEAVPAAAQAMMPLPFAVRVSIAEAPRIEDTADSDGNFILEGDFAGPVTLRFSGPHGVLGTLPVDVPAGADVVLDDIDIRLPQHGGVMARQIRQRNFFGRVTGVNCHSGMLEVDDDLSHMFRVRLLPSTAIVFGPDGSMIGCADIGPGEPVLIEGLVHGGAPIEATQVTLRPPPRRQGPPGG